MGPPSPKKERERKIFSASGARTSQGEMKLDFQVTLYVGAWGEDQRPKYKKKNRNFTIVVSLQDLNFKNVFTYTKRSDNNIKD